jgi:hypothetical protein
VISAVLARPQAFEPRPPDPKSDAHRPAFAEPFRAQPNRFGGSAIADSRVSQMPTPGMSLVPTAETERVMPSGRAAHNQMPTVQVGRGNCSPERLWVFAVGQGLCRNARIPQ